MKDKSSNEIKTVGNFAQVAKAEGGRLTAIASNATVDRDNEIVLPSAFLKHLERYRRNPVILAAHTHRSPDGKPTIIGSADEIKIENDALIFTMSFATTAVAKEWQRLFDEGHARAFSIGFLPKAGAFDKGHQAYVHTEVELLEISAVPVPANPEALRLRDASGNLVYQPVAPVPAVDGGDIARQIEGLAPRVAKSEKASSDFAEIVAALRSGGLAASQGQMLLQKMQREIDQHGNTAERDLAAAVEKLTKSAGGLQRHGPVPCPAVDW
jgi:HK97 family phage prohead protease